MLNGGLGEDEMWEENRGGVCFCLIRFSSPPMWSSITGPGIYLQKHIIELEIGAPGLGMDLQDSKCPCYEEAGKNNDNISGFHFSP